MRTMRLTVAALTGITLCAAARYGSSQTLRPVDQPWTGSARCQLDIQGPGYTDQQIHTWTLMGGTPTIQGAFRVYPGTWSVTGGGSWQRTSGTQTSSSQWTRNAQGVSAPIAVLARASDGAVVIQAYHGQLVARGGITGTQQVVLDGRSLPPSQIVADAFEWAFPAATGTPTSTTLSGSSAPVVSGSIGYLQPAGTQGRGSCTWQFSVGGTAPSAATATAAIVASPTITLSSPAPVGTIQQVDTISSGTVAAASGTTSSGSATVASGSVLSGAVVSPLGSSAVSTVTRSLATAPSTIALAGFTASGSFVSVPPRTITLAGFTAAGASAAVAPRTITLSGFTAAGVSAAVAPRTIQLTGFTAAGTASAVAPRTIPLTGWTSSGP